MRILLMALGFLALVNELWMALLIFVHHRDDRSAKQYDCTRRIKAPAN